jgi:hypothetical protein
VGQRHYTPGYAYDNNGNLKKDGSKAWVRAMPSNLDAFNANLRAGMSYEEAATNTFTGHMLAKYGLTEVTVDPSTLLG